jgi:hypothetical protein
MSPSEERKLTLPVGHPQAGYVGPDLSGVDGVTTFSPEEQKLRDERQAAYEDDLKAVTDNEDKVARDEAKAAEAAAKQQQADAAKTTTPTTTKASSGS